MKELLQSTLEKIFLENVTPELVMASEETGWSDELWGIITESGFCRVAMPEEAGGADACWDDIYPLIKLCGRFAVPLPLPETILANWLLSVCGLDNTEESLSICSDTELSWDGETFTGVLPQIPWGRSVSRIVAVAREPTGVARLIALPVDSASSISTAANIAAEPRDDLIFTKAKPFCCAKLPAHIPEDIMLKMGAMLRSAQISGALEAAMEIASSYVNERNQFGRPIAKFQAVQHSLAVLAQHVGAARTAAEASFLKVDSCFDDVSLPCAKIITSEAASVGAATTHSVHGAIGFTREYRLHLLTRRLWAWRSEYGSATYWSEQLGRAVCTAGADNFWPSITASKIEVTQP